MIEIVMPQMGESLAEGTIVKWLKEPGARVERDEPIVEISTDKVDTDVPAPVSGVLRQILAEPGVTVAVGTAVGLIETEGAAAEAALPPPAARVHEVAGEPTKEPAEEPGGHFKSTHAPQLVSFRRGDGGTARGAPPASAPAAAPVGAGPPARPVAPAPSAPVDRSRAEEFSPAVLDAARRGQLDLPTLVQVPGTGRGGRITKQDVQRFLAEGGARAASVAQARGPQTPGPVPPDAGVPPEYVYRPADGDRRVPMTPVRRKIAHHMTWSTRISPHATAFADCNMAAAAAQVAAAKAAPSAWQNGPLTYTVLAARAAVLALAEFDILNTSVVGDDIVYKPHVNLGVAVALPDTNDLIVPVVPRAEELSLQGLARAINDVASRARARDLRLEDLQGGTFTLTNPGIFGGTTGTPILNQPQVAILGLGAIVKKPVVIDEAIAVRPVMTMSLTFDHRAADGMIAFRYLDRVRELLESADALR